MGTNSSDIVLASRYEENDPRVRFLYSYKTENPCVAGNVAECGVFQGDFAHYINKYYFDRKCFLFDSFEGFQDDFKLDEPEQTLDWLNKNGPHFRNTDIEIVKLRVPFNEVIIRKGFIPETFNGLEQEKFAFVGLDMDLYEPQLAALRFFLPRMSRGGLILLHDYDNPILPGTRKAVDEVSSEFSFLRMPVGDHCSIGVVVI
jgi:hypothetical protein